METIGVDADTRVFLLNGTGFGYAIWCAPYVEVHDQQVPDPLVHLYWGSPITLSDATALVATAMPRRRPFESALDGIEEYPPAGGLRFERAAVDTDTTWRYLGHDIDGNHLTIKLTGGELSLSLHYRVTGAALERWAVLTNAGNQPTPISRFDSAVWTMPRWSNYRISRLVGHWSGETRLERALLASGVSELASRRGISSHHANPWFALDQGTAEEDNGDVYAGALAWSGSWQLSTQRLGTRVQVFGGWIPPQEVAPGETLRSPTFVGVYTPHGFTGASQALHAYAARQVIPHQATTRPVLYNSWEATGFAVDEASQMALAQQAATLGVELFVVDDGWFGSRTSGRAGLGDWQPNPDRFPHGLGPLIHQIHQLGMGFGLWVEPEMVNPDSDLYRAHPDWTHQRADRPLHLMRHQLVLDLSRPEVQAWTHHWLDDLLSANDIQFIKWDMNRPLVDVPSRDAIGHVHGLYGVLDRLRADHPGVAFENCSGGGGRVDLGMLSRTDQTWTSDNTDAADRMHIQHGFSHAYPARVMSCWVTDSPDRITGRHIPLRFRFHVAMAGVLGLGGDLTAWPQEDRVEASALVARYKQVRHLVQHGTHYRLGAPGEDIHGVQYIAHDGGEALVLAYREVDRYRNEAPPFRLRGLHPEAQYRIDDGEVRSGHVLQHYGLPIALLGDYASELIHLIRVS